MTFENKVAFVSGVAGDIGFATAKAFAKAGAAVAVTDMDENAAVFAAQELTRGGHRALGIRCDVTDEDSVANAVDRAVAELGWLDVAYNDAALDISSSDTGDASASDFDRVIQVHLKGVWLCMKHQLRRMRQQGRGAIVNCTSPSGLAGFAGLGAYTAAKHGVIGFTRAAALEHARNGIRINAICPDTDLASAAAAMRSHPQSMKGVSRDNMLGRTGTPQETVLWLCGPRARFMIGEVVAPMAPAPANGARPVPARQHIEGPYRPSFNRLN